MKKKYKAQKFSTSVFHQATEKGAPFKGLKPDDLIEQTSIAMRGEAEEIGLVDAKKSYNEINICC